MNQTQTRRAVIVGIFVLLGILFLVAGILTIGNLRNTFSSKLHVSAVFGDVNGLQKGNNIWFSGVKIGTVKSMRFMGNQGVKVVLNIDRSARQYIRKDARVKISTDGLIGNKILVITGGTEREDAIDEGDTLAVEVTLSSEEMMNTLQENNRNLVDITRDIRKLSRRISSGQGNIGRIIHEENIYNDLSAAAENLRVASARATRVFADVGEFTGKLNARGTFFSEISSDTALYPSLRRSATRLQQMADSAAALVNQLRAASANTSTPAGVLLYDEQAGAELKTTISNLSSGSKKLDEDLEALRHSWPFRRYFRKKERDGR